jgi:hypothetical protein
MRRGSRKGIDPYSLADLALTKAAGSQRLGNMNLYDRS